MTDAPKPTAAAATAPAPTGPVLVDFLTGTPVLSRRSVAAPVIKETGSYGPSYHIRLPVMQLHCPQATCEGIRFFDPREKALSVESNRLNFWRDEFVDYVCRNCRRTEKTYALRYRVAALDASVTEMIKLGELPAFGEPRPNVVKDVLDDEIKYFERGYRAETAGLGIGAFAYYRRFVESHKDKIIAEIRKVAVAQGAKQDVLDKLDKAAKMISFENAVDIVKDAIPDSLRHSGGHNPLTLLHEALSVGIHNDDDEECLELAKDIRLLLTDLAERTTQALKDESELGQSVNRLLQKATARARKTAAAGVGASEASGQDGGGTPAS